MQTIKGILNICVYLSSLFWLAVGVGLLNQIYQKYFKHNKDIQTIRLLPKFDMPGLDSKTKLIIKTILVLGTTYYLLCLFIQTDTIGSVFEKTNILLNTM